MLELLFYSGLSLIALGFLVAIGVVLGPWAPALVVIMLMASIARPFWAILRSYFRT